MRWRRRNPGVSGDGRPVRGLRWIAACLALLGLAHAQPDARALYDRGEYAAAYEAARAVETATAHLLAARAAIAHALYGGLDDAAQRDWLGRANAAAEHALARDPDRVDALLAKAQARGELALRGSALANLDVASELRGLLDRALELAPDDPDALVAVGMWHVEVAARGVGWLYGANPAFGIDLVAQGVARAPERIDLRIEYATALALRDRRPEASEQLAAALEIPARTAFDRHQHARATALRASWE